MSTCTSHRHNDDPIQAAALRVQLLILTDHKLQVEGLSSARQAAVHACCSPSPLPAANMAPSAHSAERNTKLLFLHMQQRGPTPSKHASSMYGWLLYICGAVPAATPPTPSSAGCHSASSAAGSDGCKWRRVAAIAPCLSLQVSSGCAAIAEQRLCGSCQRTSIACCRCCWRCW